MNNIKCNLITFGTTDYFQLTAKRLVKQAESTNWFDKIFLYNEYDLLPIAKRNEAPDEINKFYHRTDRWSVRSFSDQYWWKPYMVLKALEQLNADEVLVWSDAGNSINYLGEERFFDYIKMCKDGGGFVGFGANKNSYGTFPLEKHNTKIEVLDTLNLNNDLICNTRQLASGFFLVKKNSFGIDLIKEWRDTARNNLFDATTDIEKNYPNFRGHRHDQSLLSLLVKKRWNEINNFLLDSEEYRNHELDEIHIKYPLLATRVRDQDVTSWKWGYPNEHKNKGIDEDIITVTKSFSETDTII